jgi:hypothetical protein
MLLYQCNKCEIQIQLTKVVMKVIDGKICNIGSECPKCGEYMQEVEKEFCGFPNIKRTEPSLSNRKDKLWSGVKDRLK